MSNEEMGQVSLENEAATGFDFGDQKRSMLELNAGITVPIDDAYGKPLLFRDQEGTNKPVTVTVASQNSELYRTAEAKLRKRKIDRNFTGEKIYSDQIEKAAAVTLDWQGFRNGDNPIRCDQENAKQIYNAFPFVLEKVLEAISEPDRFTSKGSQK